MCRGRCRGNDRLDYRTWAERRNWPTHQCSQSCCHAFHVLSGGQRCGGESDRLGLRIGARSACSALVFGQSGLTVGVSKVVDDSSQLEIFRTSPIRLSIRCFSSSTKIASLASSHRSSTSSQLRPKCCEARRYSFESGLKKTPTSSVCSCCQHRSSCFARYWNGENPQKEQLGPCPFLATIP